MMKNKKLIFVFILIMAFLLLMVTYTNASDDVSELPTIITDPNLNNTDNNVQSNSDTGNNMLNTVTNTNTFGNTNTNTNTNIGNNDTLPQTGVQGDTTLFIFIAICIVSAIYAYFKIRKYNNIH